MIGAHEGMKMKMITSPSEQVSRPRGQKRKRSLERFRPMAETAVTLWPIQKSITLLRFCDLSSDVLIQIFEYLSLDDMDTLGSTCKTLCTIRNHPAIDQTRTGSITFGTGTTNHGDTRSTTWDVESLLHELQSRHLDNVFQGTRTRLKLRGLGLVTASKMSKVTTATRLTTWGRRITSLEVSYQDPVPSGAFHQEKVKNSVMKAFAMILPNLRVLDMSYMKVTVTAVDAFSKYCPNLEIFRWKGSDEGLRITGRNLARCRNLKEIDVEGSVLYCSIYQRETTPRHYDPKSEVFLEALQLFCDCSSTSIERVNIKGCKWYSWDVKMELSLEDDEEVVRLADIPVEAMKRFVSKTPSLRFLASEMPSESRKQLETQYPQIRFC